MNSCCALTRIRCKARQVYNINQINTKISTSSLFHSIGIGKQIKNTPQTVISLAECSYRTIVG